MMIAASAGLGAQQQGVSFRSARRTAAAARGRLVVQAGLPPSGSKLTAGQKVTVKESIKIWHVVKVKGMDLKGQTGVVNAIVDVHNGVPISATFPVKVDFVVTPEGGKPAKFSAHFIDEELEVVN